MALNNAKCQLMNAPLDPTGLHTIDKNGRASLAFTLSAENFTFLPRENVIKYPANADYLNARGINYLRYQNPQYNDRWIYCFVRSIEYAAPETAILHIERDAWMTWCDIVTGNQCLVERERVVTDTTGAYLLPEPVSITGYMCGDGNYKYPFDRGSGDEFGAAIVMGMFNIKHDEPQTNKDTKANFNEYGQTSLDNIYYGGIVLGMHRNSLNTALTAFAVLGADIAAVFPIPLSCLDTDHPKTVTYTDEDGVSYPFTVYMINEQAQDNDFKPTSGRDSSPWGFIPKNKKLFTYPYMMIQASNCAGTKSEYRYELFSNSADPTFTTKLALGTAPSIVIVPNYYEGRDKNLDASISNGNIPPMPSTSNAYATYMGQSASTLMFSQIRRDMDMAAMPFTGGGSILGKAYSTGMSEEAQKAHLDDLRGMGNTVSNVPSANANAAMSQLAVAVYRRYVLPEDAKRIDHFFSRFGYRVDTVKTLGWNNRADYDYIKTQGANVGGAIPVDDKAKINALFDSGITIWHSLAGYGTYDLS